MSKYCWVRVNKGGSAYGPFDSVAAAKEDIIETYMGLPLEDHEDIVAIHECWFIIPEMYLVDSVDSVLERMDELLEVPFDDQIFEVHDEKKAQAELTEMMRSWVHKHVYANGDPYITGKVIVEGQVQWIDHYWRGGQGDAVHPDKSDNSKRG